MNVNIGKNEAKILHSACPHDCPSTCALDVEITADGKIGRLRGSADNTYTAGVICAKVARYSERIYHPDRLLKPLIRKGEKGGGEWQEVHFEDALDLIAEKFIQAEQRHGAESIWPYYYAGTMGIVQINSIRRLTYAKRYSSMHGTVCITPAWTGFAMGTGAVRGVDPREMAKSDCIVIWGTNPVSTQINVWTHAAKARKTRGTKIVVIDIYDNPTMKQADHKVILKPGTDGALACAFMHILFRDGLADWDYLNQFSDDPKGLEAHMRSKTPQWASEITGLPVEEIEALAKLMGNTKRTYLRLGYGFARQQNGAVNMHAALSIATVLGAWQYEGGGAFHNNAEITALNASYVTGTEMLDHDVRVMDQSKIGRVLTGDSDALLGGPGVHAMLIQNTNPMNIAPEQRRVRDGFMREDLFTAVHEQFMTDTAKLADVVLPATMFLEHDDIYKGGGHQHVILGPKAVDAPENELGGPRENLYVIDGLAKRLGLGDRDDFNMTARQHLDRILSDSGYGEYDAFKANKWIDEQPDFETSHFLNGFAHEDGKFHFKPNWKETNTINLPPKRLGRMGDLDALPEFPDYLPSPEVVDDKHKFRFATSPARAFLNSTFAETPSSIKQEGGRPEILMHPDDAGDMGISEGELVTIGNDRGEVSVHTRFFDGLRRGVLIQEGLWPNSSFTKGEGINTLTSADSIAPFGGVAFHDNKVWLKAG